MINNNYIKTIDMARNLGIDFGLTPEELKRYDLIAYLNEYHKDINQEKLRELDTFTIEKILEKLEEERINNIINDLRK